MLTRRRFLRAGAAGACVAAGVDAFAFEPAWLDVTTWNVDVPSLPSELEGLVVAHVTDVHLTSIGRLHRAIAEALARIRPDLVVVTGDVVDADEHVPRVADLVALLRSGGSQVVATLGNWEHWGKVDRATLASTYAAAGARLLVDESVDGPRGLAIVATDDAASAGADFARAFRDAPRDRPRLVLTHAPGVLDGPLPSAARGVLTLAGHTHGGQVRAGTASIVLPPGSGRFVAGPYDAPIGPVFVSRGIGTSVVPARFCCRPELPILRLRSGPLARIVA